MARAHATTDHQAIRRWIETHDGHPSVVRATQGRKKGSAGLLRVDFGTPEESLAEVSWDEFFDTFERNNLAFLYQDETASRFHKFVSRDSIEEDLDDSGAQASSTARDANGSSAAPRSKSGGTRQASPAEEEEAEEIDEEDAEEEEEEAEDFEEDEDFDDEISDEDDEDDNPDEDDEDEKPSRGRKR
jgi:hypothetical protein